MRINRLIIKKSGPLKNIDITFKSVTLIIGDNERGKTCLINWIARSIFEKPGKNSFGEIWADSLDVSADMNCLVQPLSAAFDQERMKNLLFFKASDLQFTTKNYLGLSIDEYWNYKLQQILYGQDDISLQLQKTFFHAMGVSAKNTWLSNLYEQIFILKQTLESLSPKIELVRSQELGLATVNESLGKIDEQEGQIESKQELYFLADKIDLGKTYLDLFRQYESMKQEQTKFKQDQDYYKEFEQDLYHKEDKLCQLEDQMTDLKIEIGRLKDEEENIKADPSSICSSSIGMNVFNLLVGTLLVGVSIYIAFHMRTALFNIYKIFSLILFVIGSLVLLKTWIKSISIQLLSNVDKKSFVYDYVVEKARKKYIRKNQYMEKLSDEYDDLKDSCREMRKQLKTMKFQSETRKTTDYSYKNFLQHIQQIADKIYHIFGTDQPEEVEYEIKKLEYELGSQDIDFSFEQLKQIKNEKNHLLEEKINFAQHYESERNNLVKQIKPLIEKIKSNPNTEALNHFYPEIQKLNIRNDLSQYEELSDLVETLSDQISKDMYYAEKLVKIYQSMETGRDHLLVKVLESPFFNHLVHNIFGGKYQKFIAEFDQENKIKIYALTGHQEKYPLESLSASACAQFWFMLRLVLARTILGERPGIILLDDPFVAFDVLRKKTFVELLNAFVHQGWQVVCTLTDDPMLVREFEEYFSTHLEFVDLNKDCD